MCTRAGLTALGAVMAMGAGAGSAFGQLEAHFAAMHVYSGCWVDDHEGLFLGDPERHFRMGIFDSPEPHVLLPCHAGCPDDRVEWVLDGATHDFCLLNTGCDHWDFSDQYLVKVIPNQSGAYFYFGLFDEDSDASDSLGDHWISQSTCDEEAWFQMNNNVSPYRADAPISSVCGWDVEGAGDARNYSVKLQVWFTDRTGPSSVPTPRHNDATAPAGYNDDDRLDFSWTAAEDAESGISGYTYTFGSDVDGTIVTDADARLSRVVTVCPSGCDVTLDPVDGRTYWLRVKAYNGGYPEITDVRSRESLMVEVIQRLPCRADLDGDSVTDVFDLLVYLQFWFALDPVADWDGASGVDVFDLLAYLEDWFVESGGGC